MGDVIILSPVFLRVCFSYRHMGKKQIFIQKSRGRLEFHKFATDTTVRTKNHFAVLEMMYPLFVFQFIAKTPRILNTIRIWKESKNKRRNLSVVWECISLLSIIYLALWMLHSLALRVFTCKLILGVVVLSVLMLWKESEDIINERWPTCPKLIL